MNIERFEIFSQATQKVFSTWTVLRLSVENGWAGRFGFKKQGELVNEVLLMFQSGRNVDPTQLANYLVDALEQHFSTVIDDESNIEVANLLCELYRRCSIGDYTLCEKVMNIQGASIESCKMQSYILAEDGSKLSDIDTDGQAESEEFDD
ncbi:hypothetical protein ACR3K2_15290 [Cryptosporidium serpentis]